MSEKISISALLEEIDNYPEDKVLAALSQLYNSGIRNIFNDKFIALTDIMIQGYKGFRQTILSIYEVNPDFIMANLGEIRTLLIMLKSVDH